MSIYIGTMSGTSVDGIDVAAVDFSSAKPKLIHALCHPFAEEIKHSIHQIISSSNEVSLDTLGALDTALGYAYAAAVKELLSAAALEPSQVVAVGNHGQTVRHLPDSELPFSMQIGDPNIIAEQTGIQVVADFRRRDIAAGGQGAPLVPAFHKAVFASDDESRVILNIGGIANITILERERVRGFDTGPGNTLLDAACRHYLEEAQDTNGELASQGQVEQELFKALASDSYFTATPPKSTGREHFNLDWLQNHLREHEELDTGDLLATLTELSAWSIARDIKQHAPDCQRVLACGGGIHNTFLMERISALLDQSIETTNQHGLDADWVEATAFAWLAKQTIERKPGNLIDVTGASAPRVLGATYSA